MNSTLDQLISKIISASTPCKKLLEYDGISSKNLLLRNYMNSIILKCKDVNALKNINKDIGTTFTIIKNLDEYQHIICSYIPHLDDSNVFKIKFQKIRILIYLLFDKVSIIILDQNNDQKTIKNWNVIGNSILLETSELILQFRENNISDNTDLNYDTGVNVKIDLNHDHFSNFQISEEQINNIIYNIYGIKKI